MKRVIVFSILACLALSSIGENAYGQKKKKAKAKSVNTKKKNTNNITQAPPPVDTTAAVKTVSAAPDTSASIIPVPNVLPSLRNNSAVERNFIKDKTPLAYENIREDDQLYKQVIWRNIETREKMNLPFRYDADDDNGNQRFIYILLSAIKNGDLTAFSGLSDRFTTPLKLSEISELMVGKSYTIQKPDFEKDPDGSKGIYKDTVIRDEFNPETIETYQVKEEVIFDKESSRLHFRILGIAPMVTRRDEQGNVKGQFPLFWIYYPDARPILAKYEAYNPKNFANRMSWDDIFESRFFASYIVKSTLNNPSNLPISGIIKDPILRLAEGENVKETIFNYEQNLWSY